MSEPGEQQPLNYSTYLHLDELLGLQEPLTSPPEHDEMLFISVHQASEIWFKQLLFELDKVKADFAANHLYRVISSFRRAESIVDVLTQQIVVLTTMTPMSFTRFRDRLETSSGFESMQFRELEALLGMKNADLMAGYPTDLPGRDAAIARLHQPSVVDAFYEFLAHRDVVLPASVRDREATAPTQADEQIQEAIYGLYRFGGEYRILFELMVDFDEAVQQWRYQHIKMIERTIGNKMGTGGSLGVAYLQRGLFRQAFPDLWAIRHRF